MVGNGGVALRGRVVPDFVASGRLDGETQGPAPSSAGFGPLDFNNLSLLDVAVTKAGEPSHQVAIITG